jgi:hypothetical protein
LTATLISFGQGNTGGAFEQGVPTGVETGIRLIGKDADADHARVAAAAVLIERG